VSSPTEEDVSARVRVVLGDVELGRLTRTTP
jgi:hypothetical protein